MSKDKALFTLTDNDLANAYSFPVRFEYTGNQNNTGKAIETGHGTTIYTAPGLHVTVWADEDGDGIFAKILSATVSGPVKVDFLPNGNEQHTYNGWNLIPDPAGAGDPVDDPDGAGWYKLTAGHFIWTGDSGGNTVDQLSGHGQVTNLSEYFIVAFGDSVFG